MKRIYLTEEQAKIALLCIKIVIDKYDRDYNEVCDSIESKLRKK